MRCVVCGRLTLDLNAALCGAAPDATLKGLLFLNVGIYSRWRSLWALSLAQGAMVASRRTHDVDECVYGV